MELVLQTVCPEIKSEEVLQAIKRRQGRDAESEREEEKEENTTDREAKMETLL